MIEALTDAQAEKIAEAMGWRKVILEYRSPTHCIYHDEDSQHPHLADVEKDGTASLTAAGAWLVMLNINAKVRRSPLSGTYWVSIREEGSERQLVDGISTPELAIALALLEVLDNE